MQARIYHRERRYRLPCPPAEKGPVLSYPNQQLAGYHQPHPYQPAGPVFAIGLIKHTGALIFWQQQTLRFTGTLQQCEKAYRDAQTHCLLAGWWSLLSAFLMNWIALFSNLSAIGRVRRLAQQAQATLPGWYADPSGQPGQRYWDGATWTHWTNPPSHG
jgi:hypothetical protein